MLKIERMTRKERLKLCRYKLAAEAGFEHANNGILAGDNLRLPDEHDRHDAHGENTDRENHAGLRFRSGQFQQPTKPFHGHAAPAEGFS
jgi:hypothetical protein